MAGRSGPAFSTNSTYSNPATSNYISQYNDALRFGYHVGIGLDHDTHNSVFGRQTAGRLVVLAPTLTKANIYNAFKKMRFYASDDWNAKVNFQILNQPMGSIMTHSGTPTLSVTITDPDVAESVSSIVVYYGVPGSGTICTALTTVTNTANLTYTHAAAVNLSKYYYYLEITQADGDIIWTSPIWYNRNDAVVTAVPVASCSTPTTTICSGQSATFTDASTNNPTSWTWNAVGATPSSSSLQNPTFTYTASGTYSVTLVASNLGGSSAMITKTLTVKALPSVVVNSPSICVGSSTLLTVSGATSYSWSTGVTTNTISVAPTTTTSYTVSGTALGCSKAIIATVTVKPLPALTVNSVTICSGKTATLTVSGASTYSWNTGATSNTIAVSPITNTNYTVNGTSLGCSKSASSSVVVNANPSTPTITSVGNTLTSSATTGNQWYLNGVFISGATTQTYVSTQNGNYTDVVTNTFSCSSATSNTINITTTSIDAMSNSNVCLVYPNPTSGLVTINLKSTTQPNTIELVNELGQTLQVLSVKDCKASCVINMDLKSFSNGVYFIKITSTNSNEFQKIILNK